MRRHSVYDETKAAQVLTAVASGASLREACKKARLKVSTVAVWAVRDTPPGFRARYFESFAARILLETDDMLGIVDGAADTDSMARVQAARTRADMRRWLASKLMPELAERVAPPILSNVSVNFYMPIKGDRPDSGRLIEGQATDCHSAGTEEETTE